MNSLAACCEICERRLCMRQIVGSFHTNLRYSRRYATSEDRWSVSVGVGFPPNEPVRRKSMLEVERTSSDSGGGNFWIFRTGSLSMASLIWWVIPTARERPSAVALRSGEDEHRVGMRARKWCDRLRSSAQVARPPSLSPSTTIFDSLSTATVRYRRLSLNGNRKNQTNL